jgi:hypothetical protein
MDRVSHRIESSALDSDRCSWNIVLNREHRSQELPEKSPASRRKGCRQSVGKLSKAASQTKEHIMSLHVIVGAGPVGTAAAQILAE